MFYGAVVFNQDISSWDTSAVEDMDKMFYHAGDFNQDISSWNTKRVRSMMEMFCQAVSFNQDISAWDTWRVFDMERMFFGAEAFDQDLSSWELISIKYMDDMFIDSGLSTENYDKMLIGWAAQEHMFHVRFGASAQYTGNAAAARQKLIDYCHCEITDGGMVEE